MDDPDHVIEARTSEQLSLSAGLRYFLSAIGSSASEWSLLLQAATITTILSALFTGIWANRYVAMVAIPIIGFTICHGVSCAVALLLAISNGEKTVDHWPSMSPLVWLESSSWLVWAFLVASAPIFFFSIIVLPNASTQTLATALGACTAFPVVALSMLRSGSMGNPIVVDVVKSVARHRSHWSAFYIISLLMVMPICIYFIFAPLQPIWICLGILMIVVAVFAYAVLLGRLAFYLDDSITDDEVLLQ